MDYDRSRRVSNLQWQKNERAALLMDSLARAAASFIPVAMVMFAFMGTMLLLATVVR
ncbi:hypothetical protein [Sinorhizobium mexicanum]|uniref:hypothetical protein n=1 Tax=Sinorhizobium mexicanum TaxID=375549 RepID=UPI0015E04B7E|nr:hypothetical protein [Sinorhizobium mexicanum]MBP1885787.1 hypothetical protein [Sinorhizobium mexicanum]